MNQCDGCRRGIPVENGIHPDGHGSMACTKDRYEVADPAILASHIPLWYALARKDVAAADAFVNTCQLDHGECYQCSRLCCPHQDEMHFHHDGCPSCAEDEFVRFDEEDGADLDRPY